ncbi:hypothetical protein GOP47_0017086 [Adiantum capillus-veneris]|uniref:Uncharacterized protein n=1 Tax=Adiantum capillus-veneris TaxID=13818 RepID=A0A9D4ZDL7_ADICA|nr:hypothetical protein GOP47_0017086 [Adiantum capillus-veneris]
MLNKTLQLLVLSGNNITGRDLPECFALHNFTKIQSVSMSDNPLSITLNADIQLAPSISMLHLSACNLTGSLNDKVFEGLINDLDLSHNHLVGQIPAKPPNVTNLAYLDLSNNHFTGFDSDQWGSFTSLKEINLSRNSIAGDVESVLRILGLNCTTSTRLPLVQWWSLDLSYNKLVGQIPPSLGECANDLHILSLNHNNITGAIPQNLPRNIMLLFLDDNQLKGEIPASLFTNFSTVLELSYNELEGDLKILFSFLQSTSNL